MNFTFGTQTLRLGSLSRPFETGLEVLAQVTSLVSNGRLGHLGQPQRVVGHLSPMQRHSVILFK